MAGVYHLVGGRWSEARGRLCVWSVVGGFYGRCDRWSVVGQRFSRWSVFHVFDGRWSVFYPVSGRWSVVQGRWSVVCGRRLVGGRWFCTTPLTNSFPMTRIFYRSQVAFDHKRFLKMTVNSKFITIRIVISRVA